LLGDGAARQCETLPATFSGFDKGVAETTGPPEHFVEHVLDDMKTSLERTTRRVVHEVALADAGLSFEQHDATDTARGAANELVACRQLRAASNGCRQRSPRCATLGTPQTPSITESLESHAPPIDEPDRRM